MEAVHDSMSGRGRHTTSNPRPHARGTRFRVYAEGEAW
jgi:hypothetical protein